jgi:hypothetical protein
MPDMSRLRKLWPKLLDSRECLSTAHHGTMVVPGTLSRSPRGTHHGIIVEKPQPDGAGTKLAKPYETSTIQAECSAGVKLKPRPVGADRGPEYV